MQNFSKWLTGLAILGGAVAVGIGIAWWSTKAPDHPPSKPGGGTAVDPATSSVPVTMPTLPTPTLPTPVPVTHPNLTPGGAQAIDPANVVTNWEDRLDEILSAEVDETNKLAQLFAMFPRLPEEGKVEVAQHLANLVDDQDYAALSRIVEDGTQPESVLEVLMADLLNRPNGVKLPMFLEIARQTNHPKAEESRELLELYLDEEYGNDWPKWETKLKEWLKENPD